MQHYYYMNPYSPYGANETEASGDRIETAYLGSQITIPAGAKLPTLAAGANEAGVQSWSKKKYGKPIVGLVDAVIDNISAQLGKTIASPLTDEDIKAFQKAHGLTEDGSIGINTYAKMGITGEMYKKPAAPPSVFTGGKDLPDVGGAWYENQWVIYGGAAAALGLLIWGGISLMKK